MGHLHSPAFSLAQPKGACRYRLSDILWRSALKRAGDLSRRHTRAFGTRALDVLHIACALDLGLPRFITFDERQRKLAKAAGLKPVVPA